MNKKRFKQVVIPAALLVLVAAVPATFAVDKKAATSLQVSERQLRDLSEAIHHGRSATAALVNECQRVNEVMGGEIDFVGTDIIPILPSTAEGFGGAQYLPPRPKYVTMHMTQLGAALPLVQDEIGSLKAPDADAKAATLPYWDEMQSLWADVQKHYTALGPLTTTQPFDTNSIVSEATALNKDLEQIDKLRKDIYKAYKKDPDKGNGAATTPDSQAGTTATSNPGK